MCSKLKGNKICSFVIMIEMGRNEGTKTKRQNRQKVEKIKGILTYDSIHCNKRNAKRNVIECDLNGARQTNRLLLNCFETESFTLSYVFPTNYYFVDVFFPLPIFTIWRRLEKKGTHGQINFSDIHFVSIRLTLSFNLCSLIDGNVDHCQFFL